MTDHLVTASTAATELADESAPVEVPRKVDEVVVLDYGGQYSQLIARRLRECGVFSELLPHHVGAEEVRRRKPKGLILSGPARENDGTFNLMGALRTSMATCGYKDIAEFNRAELMIAPALMTEGKLLQAAQGVGMGSRGAAKEAHGPAEHAEDKAPVLA